MDGCAGILACFLSNSSQWTCSTIMPEVFFVAHFAVTYLLFSAGIPYAQVVVEAVTERRRGGSRWRSGRGRVEVSRSPEGNVGAVGAHGMASRLRKMLRRMSTRRHLERCRPGVCQR